MLYKNNKNIVNNTAVEDEDASFILPECSECRKKIVDLTCYLINDEIICNKCMNENYRHLTTDFMG